MIDKLSAKAAGALCSAIDNDEKYDLYKYAFFVILSSALHIVVVIILGICFGLLAESIIFYLSFILIRKFAGGYHAKTSAVCFWISFLINGTVLIIMKLLNFFNSPVITISAIISFFIILIISPVENDNKPLSSNEKKVYRTVSIIISAILLMSVFLLRIFGLYSFGNSVGFGMFTSAAVAAAEKIRKMLHKKI